MRAHEFQSFDGERLHAVDTGGTAHSPVVLCFPPCLNSHAFFDCPVADYSLMGALAAAGSRVFAYDPRGFGESHRPADGRSVTQEVELRDAERFLRFALAESGAEAVSMLAYGSGTVAACNLAAMHPQQVRSLVLMDFVWLYSQAAHFPGSVRELLLARPDGYLPLAELPGFFDGLLRVVVPEIRAWMSAAAAVVPVGPILKVWEPLPYVCAPQNIRASVLIIRGTEAGITSEADSLDFLGRVSGPVRALDVLEGAGAVPSLEAQHYRRVQTDIAWFMGRSRAEAP